MNRRLLLGLLLLASCGTPTSRLRSAQEALVDIEGSAAPLAAWFDQQRDAPRAVLLLSPV
jgi:hypothetical protein